MGTLTCLQDDQVHTDEEWDDLCQNVPVYVLAGAMWFHLRCQIPLDIALGRSVELSWQDLEQAALEEDQRHLSLSEKYRMKMPHIVEKMEALLQRLELGCGMHGRLSESI